MIKRTFYNLPLEKRKKIIDVTRTEFRKGNRQKITINSVIKNAGISRGSFYQYFDDKLDLVELCVNDMINHIVDFVRDELLLNGGDIFEIPLRIFDESNVKKQDYRELAVLTDNTNQNSALVADYLRYRARDMRFYDRVKDCVDRDKLSVKTDEEIECVCFMLFDALKAALFNTTKGGKSVDSERRILQNKIRIIKSGAAA